MGSSGGGSANPAFLSQGNTPMPDIPIAGQPKLDPQMQGSYQNFLPDAAPAGRAGYQIMPQGQGPNPSATGLTSEMFQFKTPAQSGVTSSAAAFDPDAARAAAYARDPSLRGDGRQQLAALQAGNGQFGAARQGSGLMGQQTGIGYPINWSNSNNPNVTS